jgi:hypothetical protein
MLVGTGLLEMLRPTGKSAANGAGNLLSGTRNEDAAASAC